MRTFLLYSAFFLSLCIFIYGALKQYAEGNEGLKFDSQNVREIWQACSLQFQTITPYMPQLTRISLCDCYTDQMRLKFTPEQVKGLTPEQARILGQEMKVLCPIPVSTPSIET